MEMILVVDSDIQSLKYITSELSGRRYRVIATTSVRRGYSLARAGLPELLLVDMDSPEEDSLVMIQKLRQERTTRKIPIIMMTSMPDRDRIVQATRVGVNDLIIKPFNGEFFRKRIQEGLSHSRREVSYCLQESDEGVRIVHKGNRSYILICGEIRPLLGDKIERSLKECSKCPGPGEFLIVDIRPLPYLKDEEIRNFLEMIERFKDFHLLVVAGRNLGKLLEHEVDSHFRVFLSHDEVKSYFQFIKPVH